MSKQLCMLPWISIETSPIGTARPCCLALDEISKPDGTKFDLNHDTISDIYRSQYMQDLRRQFRNNEKPKTCQRCWDEEDAGRTSKRMHTEIRLKELADKVDYNNDLPDQLWFLDLKLGNICNLKCRICGSWSSSSWGKEELDYDPDVPKKQHLAYQFLQAGQWPRKSDLFWDNLKLLLPNVKYIEFTGGEPFMIKEHFELLQYAIDQGLANNIEIHYNTNGTQYPDAEELWKHFRRVDIAFSIDDIEKRFEYQRHGAKWEDVVNNINKFHQLRDKLKNITTQVCMTVNIQNVYYLDQLCTWIDTQSFDHHFFNMLHDPKSMCISNLTGRAMLVVIGKLTSAKFSPEHRLEINKIMKFINNGEGSDGEEFREKMRKADAYRNEKFSDTHPEIAKAMGYEETI